MNPAEVDRNLEESPEFVRKNPRMSQCKEICLKEEKELRCLDTWLLSTPSCSCKYYLLIPYYLSKY